MSSRPVKHTRRVLELPPASRKRTRGGNRAEHDQRYAHPLPVFDPNEVDRAQQRALFDRHDHATLSVRLPLPPSINAYHRIFSFGGKGARIIVSAEGRAYVEAVQRDWRLHFGGWPPDALTGRLRLLILLTPRDRRAIDLDNRIKPLQDALAACQAFVNDSQFDDVRIVRAKVPEEPGWVDVTIETIPD